MAHGYGISYFEHSNIRDTSHNGDDYGQTIAASVIHDGKWVNDKPVISCS